MQLITDINKDLTLNANLLAAEVFAYCDYVNSENKYQEYIEQVIRFTFNTQNADGHGIIVFNSTIVNLKKQIDFQQGYVLESLLRIFQYTHLDMGQYKVNNQKGLKFYYENQFDKDGRAYWRFAFKMAC